LTGLNIFLDLDRARLIAFAIAAVCCVRPANALDPSRAMSQYIRDHWGQEQGFPRGPVYAITQTPDGYLWIGTQAGLVRFDGWNFALIRDSSGRFPISNVLGLQSAPDGSLWVRLQGAGLLRYRNGVFDRAPIRAFDSSITAMSQNPRGDLLVVMTGDGVLTYQGSKAEILQPAAALPRSPVLSLAETPDGDLWLGTRDAGLVHVPKGAGSPVRAGLGDEKINCILPDGAHGLWIGTDDGIVHWNGSARASTALAPKMSGYQALAMMRDRDGNLWIGTDSQGLLRVNGQDVASLPTQAGAPSPSVTALFEDRQGNLWAGSSSGLDRFRDSLFVSYSTPEGVPTDGSNPLYVDEENRMWFPPVTGGLWWVRNGREGAIHQAGLDHDIVYSIAGRPGELWLGRQHGGLTQVRWKDGRQDGAFTTKTYTHANGLAQDSVYSVYESRDGTVWAGTLSGGVSKLHDGRFTTYTISQGLASNTVAAILQTSDGTTWFGTPTGLSALTKDRWVSYAQRDGLPSDNINCLYEDSAGVLWVGTSEGLAFRDSLEFQGIAAVPPQLREQILGLAEDRLGAMWIATTDHVLRIDRAKLMHGFLTPGDIREFTVADGLRGTEGVKRQQSVVADSLGRIWFSLTRGDSVVDPSRLNRNEVPVIPHIQSISADDVPIPLGSSIRIRPGRRRILLEFVGLNLSIPDRVHYRYKLDGFDRDWNGPVSRREAIYTNLSPGSYTFHLMASDTDGVWNSGEASLAFTFEPEFWQTWWFRIALVAACALGVLAIYRLRLRQMTKQLSLRFEERLSERTRIAQELHDTLLQGFLSASMQLHVAADRLPPDSASRQSLSRVLDLMSRVIDEGRHAIRGLRSSPGASVDLGQAFARVQQELSVKDDVSFRVIVDGQPRPLHPILRDEVYRIGREALVNAFHHARAKTIEVELDYQPQRLRVSVRDDGCGIDPHTLKSGRDGHWGLAGMRERAERIDAKLHVWSRPGAGTEIELLIPSHLAYRPEHPEHRPKWWFSRSHSNKSENESEASNVVESSQAGDRNG
jgi:signal transduction histidine kinase/ligand-binding sensor domain-containing protein